ncbi:hypothetical protein BS78_05G197100 [Paspalum vaginatum]|nr:hypothetical protein BS78_05G197100 [Paspalum vaginatum]
MLSPPIWLLRYIQIVPIIRFSSSDQFISTSLVSLPSRVRPSDEATLVTGGSRVASVPFIGRPPLWIEIGKSPQGVNSSGSSDSRSAFANALKVVCQKNAGSTRFKMSKTLNGSTITRKEFLLNLLSF